MNKYQASALLDLIADLYRLINAPEPEPTVVDNGQKVKKSEPSPSR